MARAAAPMLRGLRAATRTTRRLSNSVRPVKVGYSTTRNGLRVVAENHQPARKSPLATQVRTPRCAEHPVETTRLPSILERGRRLAMLLHLLRQMFEVLRIGEGVHKCDT